jgi:hypothetical protein
MPKVKKPIRQVFNLYQFPIKSHYNQKRKAWTKLIEKN